MNRVGRSVGVLGAVCLLLVGFGGAEPASAQVAVSPAESRYLLTRTELEAVRREIELLRPDYTRAVERLQAARAAGDARGAEEMFREAFVAPAVRMQALNQELAERSVTFQEARRDYLRALDARMDEILDQLQDPDLPVLQEERLTRLYVELSQTYREVERERNPIEEAMLRPIPTLAVDERDGPQELRDKASYLEREVAGDYEAVITFTTQEIELREGRLRMQREGADLRADLSRFDTDRLPGTGPGAPAGVPRPDDEPVMLDGPFIFADLPLLDQVQLLRSIRDQAEEARAETLERARLFRAMADGGVR